MTKNYLLTGLRQTGKSTKALYIAYKLGLSEQTKIIPFDPMLWRSPYFFGNCDKETKLIIIDELWELKQLESFLHIVTADSILVAKQGLPHFNIKPNFIVCFHYSTDDKQYLNLCKSLKNYFEIINL